MEASRTDTATNAPTSPLPGRYFALIATGMAPVAERLAAALPAEITAVETELGRHVPSAILVAAVLYACRHPANPHAGSKQWLALALRIGDWLVIESEAERFRPRLDSHRDAYMWLEAYRLLEAELGPDRRAAWRREIERQVLPLVEMTEERRDFPRYQSPFISTSTNHYALWSSTVHLAGRVFGRADWEGLGAAVQHRLAAEGQTPDGYWGEHSDAGPTPGYDYLTVTGVALYHEHSGDPAALDALRRSTEFHAYYTFPDGTPIEVIDDRNRHWEIPAWGHFGFSHYPEGRRYAAFLTEHLSQRRIEIEALGRLAQNALYFHEGPTAPIPQERPEYAHRMSVTAGTRRRGPWVLCLSGLISPSAVTNQFYLDRQSSVSIFHETLGRIVTGANAKRQPELATLQERIGDLLTHMPLASHLRMSEDGDRLGLAFHRFWAELTVTIGAEGAVTLLWRVTGKGRPPDDARLTLQLCLRAGETLETASGGRFVLGAEPLDLGLEALGGEIRHRGWRLTMDAAARLTWPVYPYNPYRNGPETGLEHAVGALSVPLRLDGSQDSPVRPGEQLLAFSLKAE